VLAKVPVRRIDGKSSFAVLTEYITQHAAAVSHSQNVWSVKTVAGDMQGIALMNERVKDPVYHYVLSWRDGDNPSDTQAFDAVTDTLTALGMQDHQWIAGVHRNTDHVHAHVGVNRINPETLKSVYPKGDWIVLDRTCRELEIKHGWSHSLGPHSVEIGDGNTPRVVRRERNLSPDLKAVPTTRARDFSAWSGLESFQEWVGKEPAERLKRALEKPDADWQAVHKSLVIFGLEYRKSGSGAIVVDRSNPEKLHAKASHIGRFASLARMEARLGPCEPGRNIWSPERTHEQYSPTDQSTRSYRQQIEGRALRREHRQAEREALYERYMTAKTEWERTRGRTSELAWRDQRASEKERFERLRDENREVRAQIRTSTKAMNKRILYSVQAFIIATKREALRLEIHQQRTELKARHDNERPGPWREWLAQQAAANDKAAISALRGLRYRDRRRTRREVQRDIGVVTGLETPKKAILHAVRWTADSQGVNYLSNDITIFRDEGERVIFKEIGEDNIRAGLMLCCEKWANGLHISGTEEFKSRATALAIEMNIRIVDQDLKVSKRSLESQEPRRDSSFETGVRPANLVDPERLSDIYGKPLFDSAPRVGRQHIGKLLATGCNALGEAIAVIDVGRDLAVIRTSLQTATELQPKVGRFVRAQSSGLDWHFVDFQRAGPELRRGG